MTTRLAHAQCFSISGETLVSVHGHFPIVMHAFVTLRGWPRMQRHAGAGHFFGTCVFLGPTFEQKCCKMFTDRYTNAMKSLTSLGYRSSCIWCAFVNIDIHSSFIWWFGFGLSIWAKKWLIMCPKQNSAMRSATKCQAIGTQSFCVLTNR